MTQISFEEAIVKCLNELLIYQKQQAEALTRIRYKLLDIQDGLNAIATQVSKLSQTINACSLKIR